MKDEKQNSANGRILIGIAKPIKGYINFGNKQMWYDEQKEPAKTIVYDVDCLASWNVVTFKDKDISIR